MIISTDLFSDFGNRLPLYIHIRYPNTHRAFRAVFQEKSYHNNCQFMHNVAHAIVMLWNDVFVSAGSRLGSISHTMHVKRFLFFSLIHIQANSTHL